MVKFFSNPISDLTVISGQELLNEAVVRSEADAVNAAAIDELGTLTNSLISQVSTATNNNTSAVNNAAAIASEATTRATADGALSRLVTNLTSTVTNNNTTTNAAITSESITRAAADEANSLLINTLTSTVNTNNTTNTAAIITEAATRATADEALSTLITSLSSTVAGNTSAITSEASTRASADSALSTLVTNLTSTVGGNTAAITTEAQTRATADAALSILVTNLTSTVNNITNTSNTAAITSEAQTRATADAALSTLITNLTSTVTGNNTSNTAAITSEAQTRATADEALSAMYTTLSSTVAAKAGGTTYSVISTGVDNILIGSAGLYLNGSNTSLNTVGSSYNVWVITASGNVLTFMTFNIFADSSAATAMAAFLNSLDSSVIVVISTYGDPSVNRLANGLDTAMYRCGASKVVYGSTSLFKAGSAYLLVGVPGQGAGSGAEKYSGFIPFDPGAMCSFQFSVLGGVASGLNGAPLLDATLDSINASVTTEAATRASADGALSTLVTNLTSTVTSNNTNNTAAITSEAATRASADTANSLLINTLSSTVGNWGGSASIAETLSTTADNLGNATAAYTINVDTNGYVSGIQLISSGKTGAASSSFIVTADTFEVIAPGGTTTQPLFAVSDVGGVSTVSITGNIIQNGVSTLTLTFIPQTTWYVNFQHGNDTTGDGKTAGTAWATIQYAIDTISAKYISPQTVFISCADGTLTVTSATRFGAYFYASQISSWYLVGNTAFPANCVIDASAVGCNGITTGTVPLTVAGFTIHAYYGCIISNGHGSVAVANCNVYGVSVNSVGFVTYDNSFMYFYKINGIGCNVYGTFNTVFAANPGELQIGWHDVLSNTPISFVLHSVTASCCAETVGGGLITFDATCASITGSLNGSQYYIDQSRIETYGAGGGVFPGTSAGVSVNYGVLT